MLDVFKADLALCVAINDRENPKNPFYEHAKYIWQYVEPSDWGDAFDMVQEKMDQTQNWRQLLQIKCQWLGGIKGVHAQPGSAGILLFFRWFLKQNILNDAIQEKYTRFIITRSDYIHGIPHVPPSILDPKYIWMPYGEDHDGYTDRHIVVNQKDILSTLSIVDKIFLTPNDLVNKMMHSNEWSIERFIKLNFDEEGLSKRLKRFPHSMYSVRDKLGHTTWSKGVFNEELGYFIKYPHEYNCFRRSRFLFKAFGSWNRLSIWLLLNYELLRRSSLGDSIYNLYLLVGFRRSRSREI
ncbi:MAG: hypothetical protein RJQ09_20485 [Cyclobacteriaceae bacterium]